MKLLDEMFTMMLEKQGQPLVCKRVALPVASSCQMLIKVSACGVCRTDLHIVNGELNHPKLSLIPAMKLWHGSASG